MNKILKERTTHRPTSKEKKNNFTQVHVLHNILDTYKVLLKLGF